jgi:NADPH:quinone reductase-like Zn-dependent oxidoreductase
MGTLAVQLAHYFGADVTGVDSARKLDILRSIGTELFCYRDYYLPNPQKGLTRN